MTTPRLRIHGLGLAGACVAWEAIERGWDIEILEDSSTQPQSASRVAGGIVSPVSGQKFSIAWNGSEFFEASREFFARISARAGTQFWRDLPTDWVFEREEAALAFRKRFGEHGTSAQEKILTWPKTEFSPPLRAELGGVRLEPSAFVDLPAFLDWTRVHLPPASSRTDPRIDVRCLGKWEDALGLGHTKGECADLVVPGLSEDRIHKRKLALIPLGAARFRASATFENRPTDALPSTRGRAELAKGLARQLITPPTLIEHRAGLRTHASDHLPVLGLHPKRAGAWMLNGLGSKGVLWSPLCARWLLDAIASGSEVPIPESLRASRLAATSSPGP